MPVNGQPASEGQQVSQIVAGGGQTQPRLAQPDIDPSSVTTAPGAGAPDIDPSTITDVPLDTSRTGTSSGKLRSGLESANVGGWMDWGTPEQLSQLGDTIHNAIRNGIDQYVPASAKQEASQAYRHVSDYIGSLLSSLRGTQPATVARNAPAGEAQAARLANIPTQFRQMILDAAQEFHIDPLMLAAVATKESGGKAKFNPQAQGTSGERGVMQIMPNTWRGLTKSIDNPQGQDFNLAFDPQTNIRMGAKYLGQLMRQYDDDESEALFHYNARNNISAGQAYAQDVLRIMGKLSHDEGVAAKGGTVTAMPPPAAAAQQQQQQPEAARDWAEGPSGASEPEAPAQPEMQEESLSDLINRVTGHPNYKSQPLDAKTLAIGLVHDPVTLMKAYWQGMTHAATGQWYLGRSNPEEILEAGGRIAGDMLGGIEAGAPEAGGEAAAEAPRAAAPKAATPAAEAAAPAPAEAAAATEPAAPAATEAPAAKPARGGKTPNYAPMVKHATPGGGTVWAPRYSAEEWDAMDAKAKRVAWQEARGEAKAAPAAAPEPETPAAPKETPAAKEEQPAQEQTAEDKEAERTRLYNRLAELYQETQREYQVEKAAEAEKAKTAKGGEDLTKALKGSLPPKKRSFAPATRRAKAQAPPSAAQR